jgi:hypothetical protein
MANKDNLVRREDLTDAEYERVSKLFEFIRRVNLRKHASNPASSVSATVASAP